MGKPCPWRFLVELMCDIKLKLIEICQARKMNFEKEELAGLKTSVISPCLIKKNKATSMQTCYGKRELSI